MPAKIQFRFQHWVLMIITAMVLILTSAFLVTVFGKFTTMTEGYTKERFNALAGSAAGEIEEMVGGVGDFVAIQAGGDVDFFVRDGKINTEDLVPTFLTSLDNDGNIYGHFSD
jgi:hypothetical protein